MKSSSEGRERLRLWHVAEAYPPDYGGGAAIYTRDVCRYLAERGHEVRVFAIEGTEAEPYTIRTDYEGPVRIDRINLPHFKLRDPEGWLLGLKGWRAHQKRLVKEMVRVWVTGNRI